MTAHGRLVEALREHALVLGEVTLTSGLKAQYYVDAKRAILLPDGFRALGELLAARARAARGARPALRAPRGRRRGPRRAARRAGPRMAGHRRRRDDEWRRRGDVRRAGRRR